MFSGGSGFALGLYTNIYIYEYLHMQHVLFVCAQAAFPTSLSF